MSPRTYSEDTVKPHSFYSFKKFPEIRVAVDEDRVDGVQRLLKSNDTPEVILLDDAFQHRNIRAGLNILLTEYQHLYCDDFLVPAGTLRDVKSAAKRADFIVVSKSPKEINEVARTAILAKLKPLEHQKVFFSYLEYAPLHPLNEKAKAFSTEKTDSVLAFCGIANSKPFENELKKRFKIVDFLTFADHHAYTENDITTILKRYEDISGGNKIIVTTEKDAARLTNSPYLCQFEYAPLYDLPVYVRFYEEEKFNKEILDYVRKNSHYR